MRRDDKQTTDTLMTCIVLLGTLALMASAVAGIAQLWSKLP